MGAEPVRLAETPPEWIYLDDKTSQDLLYTNNEVDPVDWRR